MLDVAAPTETPKTAAEIAELVADAHGAGRTLEIIGGGTKRGVGAPVAGDAVVSLAGLDQVVDYAPEELVLTAQPGVTLDTLEKLVASHGQMLPFEPPHLTKLLGSKGRPTLGGVLSANLSGPRRLRAGAARDHFLGLSAVTGRGEVVKAGGKVVKNVTGYDLPKLIAGSWGTLAVMTEVTIKVLPAARTEVTLLVFGLNDRRACEAMGMALGAPVDVSGAAHLPAQTAKRPPLKADMAVTALRLEGFASSVSARVDKLSKLLNSFGKIDILEAPISREFWIQIREVEALHGEIWPLWRISVPPASGWEVSAILPGFDVLYDWGGGLVWLLEDEWSDLRCGLRELNGHSTVYRDHPSLPAFEPLNGPLAALSARVKAAFDPKGVLNPGRMGLGR